MQLKYYSDTIISFNKNCQFCNNKNNNLKLTIIILLQKVVERNNTS